MSYSIGLWVRDTAIKLIDDGIVITKNSLASIHGTQQFSGTNTGADNKKNPWKYQTGIHGIELNLKQFL